MANKQPTMGGGTVAVKLPKATPEAALQFSDWLHAVKPSMSDLSDSSAVCWESVLTEARKWYDGAYVPASPVQRLRLRLPSSSVDGEPRWARVKHRMEHLVLQACPDGVREELSAARISGLLHVLCRLHDLQARGIARKDGSLETGSVAESSRLGRRRRSEAEDVEKVAY